MKKKVILSVLWIMTTALSIAAVFAQNNSQHESAFIGTWKPEKEGLMVQFNADGTFIMFGEGENVPQTTRSERRSSGEAMVTSAGGTYTVTDKVINMSITVDGKNYSMRKSYRKINENTLRVDRQNYRRVS
jgi:hypothetical protein